MLRRNFVLTGFAFTAGSMSLPFNSFSSSKKKAEGFFTVAQKNDRWWLVTPEWEYIFSIGLNHLDPAAIRFLASNGIWDEKYGNSMEKWLPKVKADLTGWGFNCLEWEQEVVIIQPEMEKTESGRKEIFDTATVYYKTIVNAIKRYDPNHLICGDRYEANAPISREVLRAAMPYVDIFSFQCFGTVDNINQKMSYWASYLKKPVLLADSMISAVENHGWPPKQDLLQDDIQYGEVMKVLRNIPECIEFHLCGAYIKNNARRYGLLELHDKEEATTNGIKKVNFEQEIWAKKQTK